MNKLLTKKIVAIVMTVASAALIAGPALALTQAELQAMIDSLMAQIVALQAQLGQTTGGATVSGCSITSFTKNLTIGAKGDDVKCLQIILNSDSATQLAATGAGSPGNETTTFGPITKAAVIKFQEKYASEVLTPIGLTAGTGFVGAKSIAKLNTMIGSVPVTPTSPTTPTTPAIPLSIALASDTPGISQTALNSQDVVFTKIQIGGGSTDIIISKIIVSRGGVSADADISSVKIYDGATQLGSTQAINTLTHKATFSSLNWVIPVGTTKVLTIKGSIAPSGTATVGDSIKLGINSVADITSTISFSGIFPLLGNAKTIAGISVGNLDVDRQTAPATTTILSGSVEQEIASWRFNASGTEGFDVTSITVTQVGSATQNDITNIKLKVSGVQIGSTIASLDSQNKATFDLSSSPLSINASASKTVYAYADIAAGGWTARTIIFEITQATDVTAFGNNSGGSTTITYNSGTAYARQRGDTMTIGQGTLTVALDTALNPAAQHYVKGTTNRPFTAIKFSTGAVEGVRVTKLVLTLGGSGAAATDLSNITLWDGSTQIAGSASVIGSSVTFGANTVGFDSTGLFDVEKSSVKTILVKADINNGATTDHTLSLSLSSNTNLWVDGLNSQYDIAQTVNTVSATGEAHTVDAYGSLTASKSTNTPAAQTFVIGAMQKELTRMDLTAGSGEDIMVSAITLDIFSNRTTATSGAKFINVKLVKLDGTQFGSTVAAPVSSAAFSGNLTIPASETVTLRVLADIPTTSYPSPNGSISLASTTAIATAIDSTGVSSSASITETGSAIGNTMTIGSGALTVAVASTPGDQTLIVGAAEVPVARFVLTAGTAEDVRVTYIKLWDSASAQSSTTDLSGIALYDGTTRLTAKKNLTAGAAGQVQHYVTFNASEFLNSIGINITKGQQKEITVKADIPSTGTAAHKVAIGIATAADIVSTGLSSNIEIAETITAGPSTATGANYDVSADPYGTTDTLYEVTLASAGTLAIANSAAKPNVAIVSVGQSGVGLAGVVFQVVDFKADLEDIFVKTVQVGRLAGSDADFGAISIWDGATQLGVAQTLANGSTTFSLPEGSYWLLTKGVTKTLTIKADLNGITTQYGYGASTGDAPLLRIDNVTVQGVSSGSTAITTATGLQGNVQYLRQSKPTLASASIDTSLGVGEKILYRWTVTADSKGDIGWKKIIFNMSGSINYPSATVNTPHTIGCIGTESGCASTSTDPTSKDDGVYMSSSTDAGGVLLIATSTMKIYDLISREQITASSTGGTGWTVKQSSGSANIQFVAANEEIVPAGQTKTYELRGTVIPGLYTVGADSIMTKIADVYSTATTTNYAEVALSNGSFIWTDRSGAGGTHNDGSADWTHDYKVSGIPTAPLTMTR